MRNRRLFRDPWVRATVATGAALLLAVGPGGLRLQWTPSIPQGLYLERDLGTAEPATLRDRYVSLCLDEPHAAWALERTVIPGAGCPLGTGRIAKRVIAGPGDVVIQTPSALSVNGRPIAGSATVAEPAPDAGPGRYRLGPDELWIYAPHPRSLDSRLIGPVRLHEVRGTLTDLWTL